jgi:hypothetical protein
MYPQAPEVKVFWFAPGGLPPFLQKRRTFLRRVIGVWPKQKAPEKQAMRT